jgi:hypothetical protein
MDRTFKPSSLRVSAVRATDMAGAEQAAFKVSLPVTRNSTVVLRAEAMPTASSARGNIFLVRHDDKVGILISCLS